MYEEKIICKSCGKAIEFERPNFCPHCGVKIDPTEGLELEDEEIKIYKWSSLAPALVRITLVWLVLLIPVAWIWGKSGVAVAATLYSGVIILLTGISLLFGRE